jgi:hypothetical protein
VPPSFTRTSWFRLVGVVVVEVPVGVVGGRGGADGRVLVQRVGRVACRDRGVPVRGEHDGAGSDSPPKDRQGTGAPVYSLDNKTRSPRSMMMIPSSRNCSTPPHVVPGPEACPPTALTRVRPASPRTAPHAAGSARPDATTHDARAPASNQPFIPPTRRDRRRPPVARPHRPPRAIGERAGMVPTSRTESPDRTDTQHGWRFLVDAEDPKGRGPLHPTHRKPLRVPVGFDDPLRISHEGRAIHSIPKLNPRVSRVRESLANGTL